MLKSKYLSFFFIVFFSYSSFSFGIEDTRIKILGTSRTTNDFYSGNWVSSGQNHHIEMFIWWKEKTRNFNQPHAPRIDRWRALIFEGNDYISLYDAYDNPRLKRQDIQEIGGEFGFYQLVPSDSENTFYLKSEVNLRDDTPLQRALKDESGTLVFNRSKVSDDFVTLINKNNQIWKTHAYVPTYLAIKRSENPSFEVSSYEKQYIRKYGQPSSKQLTVSEITLSDFRNNKKRCGYFSEDEAHMLFESTPNKSKERYLFITENLGVRAFMPQKSIHPLPIGLNLLDEDKSVGILCNDANLPSTSSAYNNCPFCFYKAGKYLDSIYHGSNSESLEIARRYMSHHKDKYKNDYTIVSRELFHGGKPLSLIEEVMGFYLLNYTHSPKSCFKQGAREVSKTIALGGYSLVDGFGYEVFKVDSSTSTDTYRFNPEFLGACNDLCSKHGLLITDTITEFLSKNNDFIKKEKRMVLDVFISIRQLMNDYDCNSMERKRFEMNLIKLYQLN